MATVGLLGAACGSDDDAAVADQSVSAPVTSASTDTAANDEVISVEAAAEQYVAQVAAPNCAIDELNAAIAAVATTPSGAVAEDQWPAIQATVVPALVKVEVTGREWATALLRAEWPPLVASDVEELALAVTDSANVYGEIAVAEDFDTFFELYNSADTTAVFDASAAAARTVREDLGLDSVTTDPPDWCALAAPS
ncbi:MAG: hypothetical protein EHM63_05425 [Actinobacteria bacterium]|nr:MAG: hypothetical protein EHM63_05425 [Actinomycetota bacterium]